MPTLPKNTAASYNVGAVTFEYYNEAGVLAIRREGKLLKVVKLPSLRAERTMPKKQPIGKLRKSRPWDDADEWGDDDESTKKKKPPTKKKKQKATPVKNTVSIFADDTYGVPMGDDEDEDEDEDDFYPELELERSQREEAEQQLLRMRTREAIKYGEIISLQEAVNSLTQQLQRAKTEFAKSRCPYAYGQILQYQPERKEGDKLFWVDYKIVDILWTEEEPYYHVKAKRVAVTKRKSSVVRVQGKVKEVQPNDPQWRTKKAND